MHGHVPVACDRLLRAVAEIGLIAGVLREGAAVGSGLVGLDALFCCDKGRVLHHDAVVGISVVVLHAEHTARNLVERIAGLGPQVGAVRRVGIHVNVVAVIDAEIPGGLRIHVELVFSNRRRPFVQTVRIAEIRVVKHVPIDVGPARVHPVARLGSQAVKLEPLLPEEVPGLLHLVPRHLDVADGALVPVLGVERDAVILRADVRIGAHDDVGQIGSGLRPFAVDDEIFSILDRFRDVGVGVQATCVGVEWFAVVHLLVEGYPRVGAEVQQAAARRAVLSGHNVLQFISGGCRAGVEQPLDVDPAFVRRSEGKIVAEAFFAGHIGQTIGNAREDH